MRTIPPLLLEFQTRQSLWKSIWIFFRTGERGPQQGSYGLTNWRSKHEANEVFCICYDCVLGVFVGLLTVGLDVSLDLFLLLRVFPSYSIVLSSPDRRVFTLSYCILLCLSSFGDLFFFWRGNEQECIWGKGEVKKSGKSGGKGKHSQDILYEKRIYFQ